MSETRLIVNKSFDIRFVKELDGEPLKHARKLIEDLISKFGEEATYSYSAYEWGLDEEVIISRPETDQEMELRIKREGFIKEDQKRRDLAELERLKKLYNE